MEYGSVTTRQVHDLAAGWIAEYLEFGDYGRRCKLPVLISVLLFAAARAKSIADACLRLRNAPCGETIFNALAAWLPLHAVVERRLCAALAAKLPGSLRKKRQRLAIDLTEIPYHGRPQRDRRELRRGKPKGGSTHFHAYATVYVVRHGERFTLAMTYVWKDDTLRDVVRRLMQKVRKIGVQVDFLLLDREFYSLDVVRYLKRARYPFLMPVVRRGRRPQCLAKARGPWKFWSWKRSGWATHMLQNKGRRERVDICVAVDNYAGRWGKRGRRILVYACWGIRRATPAWIRETYRTRYGIESSYRQMNQGRIRTCSRNPALRLLFVGIALILRNAWVLIHRTFLAERRGPHLRLHLEKLRLTTMLLHLQHHAEALLGIADPWSRTSPTVALL
jgi:putative transposase